jgi:hypothetical protein
MQEFLTGVVVAFAGAGFISGITTQDSSPHDDPASEELRANAFVLEDTEGKVRGRFAVIPEGIASLSLADDQGRPVLHLAVTSDGGATVSLMDANAQTRASLFFFEGEGSGVTFSDANGQERATLGMDSAPDAMPGLTLVGPEGDLRTVIGAP